MAITWEFEITPVDIPQKIVRVKAVRTDDMEVEPEYMVTLQNADISTPEKKAEALNVLWDKFLVKKAENAVLETIQTEIEALEATAKTNFEGREL